MWEKRGVASTHSNRLYLHTVQRLWPAAHTYPLQCLMCTWPAELAGPTFAQKCCPMPFLCRTHAEILHSTSHLRTILMETLKEPVRCLTASIGIAYLITTTPITAGENGRVYFLNIWTILILFQRKCYQRKNICGYLTLFLKQSG